MWNLPAPPGFQGFRPHEPVRVYFRRLPHWRQDGATYFVTFRLKDSLPECKRQELDVMISELRRKRERGQFSHEVLEDSARAIIREVEVSLDKGFGSCVLKNRWASSLVAETLHHFDNDRYELACYVVMPNHVHVIVRPTEPATMPLEDILRSWKIYSARQINSRLQTRGDLWQAEHFDRIIRDEEHLYRAIGYIGRNPAKAGLMNEQCPRWIRDSWQLLGWRFED